MLATALALAASAAPTVPAGRAVIGLRVEAVVVSPPRMPTIGRDARGVAIDNPGAVEIGVDDEPLTVRRTLRLSTRPTLRRVTFVF